MSEGGTNMKKNIEIKWQELKNSYQPSDFSFNTTDDLTPIEGVIGQESATKALEFALKLESKGYNIYVSGEEGIGLFDYVNQVIKESIKNKNLPDDICYIYNFKMPTQPRVVFLQAGDGVRFKEDMKEFIQFLIDELSNKLDSYEADKKRQKLITELEDKKNEVVESLRVTAKQMGILVKVTAEGIGFIPLNDKKKPITEDQYDNLDKQEKGKIKGSIVKLQGIAEEIVDALKQTEKVYADYLEDINQEIVMREIGVYLKHLREKYGIYDKISEYLEDLAQDIVEHIGLFAQEESSEEKSAKELFPWILQKGAKDVVDKYHVNLIVDNSQLEHAPIVTSSNISYSNLIGKLRIDAELNTAHVDYSSIAAGLFHEANGGYLILRAKELFESPGAWEAIKRVIKTDYIHLENLQSTNIATTINLIPEPVPVRVKVIIIGPYSLYHLIKEYDSDFKELFKYNVDFDMTLKSNKETVYTLARKLKYVCDTENLLPVSVEGILKLVEYSSRTTGSQDKLSSDISPLLNLIREASSLAKKVITKKDIEDVLQIKQLIKQKIERHVLENYEKHIFMIDVKGKKIGQINGLAVYNVDEYAFGQPIRITSTTYKGKSGVVDIEKASGLSGNIHTKGIEIIEGLLGYKFAQTMPLSLCCRICVEQNYGGIDGDSASSAELYAILSSLAEIPIRQNLAVTGSINQYGQIQPIGGVNEKIEGFYEACKEKGLTGAQGVIIPYQNRGDLVLCDEVIEAVKNNKFHIYQVDDFSQGIELLTGYSYADVENKIMKKLKNFSGSSKIKQIKKLK